MKLTEGRRSEAERGSVPVTRTEPLRSSKAAPSAEPHRMLNTLQQVPMRINRRVLEVADWATGKGLKIGKFRAAKPPIPETLRDF